MKHESRRPNGLFILDRASVDLIYGSDQQREMGELVNIYAPSQDRDSISGNMARGLITVRHVDAMKQDATFINTSRGPIVREREMCEILGRRHDLTAILDVWENDPVPLDADSPLLRLSNVVLTPHIAGSMGREINRLGQCMVDELKQYLAGEPLKWQLSKEAAAKMA